MKKGWKNDPAWVAYREGVLEKRQDHELLMLRLKYNEQMLRIEEAAQGFIQQEQRKG